MTLLFRCCFLPVIFYALNYLEVKTRRSRQHLLLPESVRTNNFIIVVDFKFK